MKNDLNSRNIETATNQIEEISKLKLFEKETIKKEIERLEENISSVLLEKESTIMVNILHEIIERKHCN